MTSDPRKTPKMLKLDPKRLWTVSVVPKAPEPTMPLPLDFSVYRQITRRLIDCTETFDEPTGVSIPNEVRKAILERPDLESIHIYDGPYCVGAMYGFEAPTADCFYVHYRRSLDTLRVGRGNVMIFGSSGAMLYDGSDGGE